jgi:hypothetical protein
MKKRYRKDPTSGTVIRLPLPDGRFGYAVCAHGCLFWLYNFVSDFPIRTPAYFSRDRWDLPFYASLFGYSAVDVCEVEVAVEDMKPPSTWQRSFESDIAAGRGPYLYYETKVADFLFGTEEDIRGRYELFYFSQEAAVVAWMVTKASELQMIHVPPEDRDHRPAPEAPELEPEEEPRTIEVQFSPNHPLFLAKLEEMEVQLNLELDLVDAGKVCGSGSMEGGDSDIAIHVPPRKVRSALRAIRAVLKRYQAPPDTEIREYCAEFDDPVEHPLIPPRHPRKNDISSLPPRS